MRHPLSFLTLPPHAWQFIGLGRSDDTEALLTWNQLQNFHEQPAVIDAWRKLFGSALDWLTPVRRRLLLSVAALFVAVEHPWRQLTRSARQVGFAVDGIGLVLLLVTLFGFACLCYWAAKNFKSLPEFVRRHPQMSLHTIFWIVLVVLWSKPPLHPTFQTLFAGYLLAMPFLLWRCGYMFFTAQRGKMAGTRFRDHLFYLYPVWGGSDTPYGKGWDYLSANEAKNEEGLAKSQLAGVKLFLLAGIWAIAKIFLEGIVLGDENAFRRALGGFSLELPRPGELFAQPELYSIWVSWVALYVDLLRNVLSLAVKGHIIIGWVRLFGFNVFRNTYKPLLAESVVEFWNRYYYYFKELLVNFFFYPTFARYFKSHPNLRIFTAVFAAAFIGNMYYHWIGLERENITGDFPGMWSALQSRLFYCFLLASGIFISMLRQKRPRTAAKSQPGRRFIAVFGVWTFFSVIHIWAQKDPAPFLDRVRFFLGLLGLN